MRGFLARDGRETRVLSHPNIDDTDENVYRRGLLEEHRAYERRDGLFGGFPQNVDWFRAVVSRDELLEILYINWDWWLEISGGTRLPLEAARRVRAGEVAGASPEKDEPIAAAAVSQPELIAVTTPAHSPLVLLEGHVRLTAYALFPEHLPPELEILLGVSEEMENWSEF